MGATGQSGDFKGHAIPAFFFFGFGTFFLVLSLLRSQSLPPGRTLCDIHVPERNFGLIRAVSFVLVVATTLGFIYEGVGGCITTVDIPWPGCFSHQATHQILYLSFGFVGIVGLLESFKRFPADSSRMALSLALLLEYVLWNEHALMKKDDTDRRVHMLQAQVCLVSSVVFAFSVYSPKSSVAYVAGWATLVLQSMWLLTGGVNADYKKLEMHMIAAYLCGEVLLLGFVIVVVAACCGGNSEAERDNSIQNGSKEYEHLRIEHENEDFDEDEPVCPQAVV
eukprot:CAMPEP_0183293464 /NCGR_PEP_ID=MMETSP0160_2-20130417/2141_1 /TAXON_ID=2839 ORGANISM="Odontella Sinensis, Strain Grunow 1884" /NCGR_SAMPLE_ID=MMETSP0160_2 /ASSEMBLY_ACC=CAM_ASM_000250 /LENGTH=279 /DNA_ID=CAMNT_0025454585 /DNA_START=60 /DNA_END=899 /DNA_ORIENTATION=+